MSGFFLCVFDLVGLVVGMEIEGWRDGVWVGWDGCADEKREISS